MKKIKFIFLLVTILSIYSCAKDDLLTIKSANKKFAGGNYDSALKDYENLIGSQGSVARVGAGWCHLRLNNYSSAIQQFTASAGDSLVDGYAGWAVALWAMKSDSAASSAIRGEFVLRKDPAFILSLDSKIGIDEILFILASDYLILQDYAKTLEKIKLISGQSNYSANLSDPNIEDILLSKLQSLSDAHSALKIRL